MGRTDRETELGVEAGKGRADGAKTYMYIQYSVCVAHEGERNAEGEETERGSVTDQGVGGEDALMER